MAPTKLLKYRSLQNFEYFLDIVLNERLYCSSYKELNDPFEGLFFSYIGWPLFVSKSSPTKVERTIEDLPYGVERSRVCSLSATIDDVRLWSYYADSHQGIAIEIDFSGLESNLIPVRYESELPTHGTTLLGGSTPAQVLSFKSNHWQYEQEYRIIQESSFFDIKSRISRIYLGIKVSDQRKTLLHKFIPSSIPLVETKLDLQTIKVIPLC